MPSDSYMLIGLGCAALLAVWLVFSLVKKIFGLALLAALALGLFVLWNNPAMLHQLIAFASGVVGAQR
jgi:hypothetical protein